MGFLSFLVFSNKSLCPGPMSATGSIIFFLASLKCPLACFTVIWFFLFVLKCRGNKFPLIEGSYYEDLHYCFFLTNTILQKLVINVIGRSVHAIWVITLDPTCLMVCYAEQRAARSLLGERQAQKLRDSFFSNCLTCKQRAVTILWTANEAATLRTFFSSCDQWVWDVSWAMLLRVVLKWYVEGSDGRLLWRDKFSDALTSAFMPGQWKSKRVRVYKVIMKTHWAC